MSAHLQAGRTLITAFSQKVFLKSKIIHLLIDHKFYQYATLTAIINIPNARQLFSSNLCSDRLYLK